MNIFLIFLYFIVIFILLIFSYLGYLFYKKCIETKTITKVTSTTCVTPQTKMVDVSTLDCCTVGGLLTSSKYSAELNMIVNPIATPYLTVCSGFCPNGYLNGNCGNSASYDEILNFEKCVSLLEPNSCSGAAMPIAYSGSTLYYGSSAGNIGCTQTMSCQN